MRFRSFIMIYANVQKKWMILGPVFRPVPAIAEPKIGL